MCRRDITTKAAELDRYLTLFARRTLHREKTACREHPPLARPEFRAIHAIGERPDWTMGELARFLVQGMSGLTAVIDKLQEKDLVERRRTDTDRRTVHVRLTPAGRRLFAHMRRRHLHMARGMLRALNSREQDIFLGLMRKIAGDRPENSASPQAQEEPA